MLTSHPEAPHPQHVLHFQLSQVHFTSASSSGKKVHIQVSTPEVHKTMPADSKFPKQPWFPAFFVLSLKFDISAILIFAIPQQDKSVTHLHSSHLLFFFFKLSVLNCSGFYSSDSGLKPLSHQQTPQVSRLQRISQCYHTSASFKAFHIELTPSPHKCKTQRIKSFVSYQYMQTAVSYHLHTDNSYI